MAAPPDGFCAHDHSPPGFVSKIDKSFYAFAKFLGFDVIGVTAKGIISPSRITRARSRFSAAAPLGTMFIMNSVLLECFCEGLFIILVIQFRTRQGSYIH